MKNSFFSNFLKGAASILDIGGTLNDPMIDDILNKSDKEVMAEDWKAVFGDFEAVGLDIQHAMNKEGELR